METLGGFETKPTLAVAVSGGADSIACMLLAQEWAQQRDGKVIALTVNHGLRKDAQTEAHLVQSLATNHHMEHHTLNITIENPTVALQEKARNLRYRVMEQFCHQRGILHLLTAHHADDHIETLAMRAWRGSGIDGLSGIPTVHYRQHLRLLRPLLTIHKRELIAWLNHKNISWAEDPSNQNDSYERNRLRKNLTRWPIDEAASQSFLKHMAIAKTATLHQLQQLAIKSLQTFEQGYMKLDVSHWPAQPMHTKLQLLERLTHSLGTSDQSPRYYQLEHAEKQLCTTSPNGFCLTGLQFTPASQSEWLITRELNRIAPATTLTSNQYLHWDGRFIIHSKTLPDDTYHVAALGHEGLSQLKQQPEYETKLALPRTILVTLPAIWRLDQLYFLPHIESRNESNLKGLVTVTPRWKRPLLPSPHRNLI